MTYFAFGTNFESTLDFSDLLPQSDKKPDLYIVEEKVELPNLQPTNIHRKGQMAYFGGNLENSFLHWPGIANFHISNKNKIVFENLGESEDVIKIFLLSEAFGLLLLQRDYFLLHGSAVLIEDFAHVFIGEPGAGKSTTAMAHYLANNPILSDDLVVIEIKNDGAYVIPSLPFLKVWGDSLRGLKVDTKTLKPAFEGKDKFIIEQNFDNFPKENRPLKEISILLNPESNQNSGSVEKTMASLELLKHWPLGDIAQNLLKGSLLKKHFTDANAIAKNASIEFKKRPKNFNDLILSTSLIK